MLLSRKEVVKITKLLCLNRSDSFVFITRQLVCVHSLFVLLVSLQAESSRAMRFKIHVVVSYAQLFHLATLNEGAHWKSTSVRSFSCLPISSAVLVYYKNILLINIAV